MAQTYYRNKHCGSSSLSATSPLSVACDFLVEGPNSNQIDEDRKEKDGCEELYNTYIILLAHVRNFMEISQASS